jgi:ribosomal-protein-alanine N-acetyltransferase
VRVRLERPASSHRDEFIAAVERSRALHGDFVAPPDTPQAYRRFVRQARLVNEVRFLSVLTETGRLAGVVTIGAIARTLPRSAAIGYYAFDPYAGRGLMREAVSLAVTYGFGPLSLGRLEASIRPDNTRSQHLAGRLGFRRDGPALHELKIGGCWYAHERWTLDADEWNGSAARERERLGPRRADGGVEAALEVNCEPRTQ